MTFIYAHTYSQYTTYRYTKHNHTLTIHIIYLFIQHHDWFPRMPNRYRTRAAGHSGYDYLYWCIHICIDIAYI